MTMDPASDPRRIAVVIPCYRVRDRVVDVIERIGPEADLIFCVDDGCPDGSGDRIAERFAGDARVRLLRHAANRGVGAATCTGYRAAIAAGAGIVVKLDGDGQMDPRLIPHLVAPIRCGEADYVKGNRFFSVETVSAMPLRRIVGNAVLSFFSKLSTGYWDQFDPVNGYTAIDASVAEVLPLDKLHPRFFFESDLLFRLGSLRACVIELPMTANYSARASNLSESWAFLSFPFLHLRNFIKRLFYAYFLRGFSVASLNLVLGIALIAFGATFGMQRWTEVAQAGIAASPGTVMLAALPVLVGLQLLLAFAAHDMALVPRKAIHPYLHRVRVLAPQNSTSRAD